MKSKSRFIVSVVVVMVSLSVLRLPAAGRVDLLHLSHVHRGGGKLERPDNTLETFKWCWENGSALECDCRKTKDGVGIKKTDKRFNSMQWRMLFVTMIDYIFFYFMRKNFSFAMPHTPKKDDGVPLAQGDGTWYNTCHAKDNTFKLFR